jgi:hypothetical protein
MHMATNPFFFFLLAAAQYQGSAVEAVEQDDLGGSPARLKPKIQGALGRRKR